MRKHNTSVITLEYGELLDSAMTEGSKAGSGLDCQLRVTKGNQQGSKPETYQFMACSCSKQANQGRNRPKKRDDGPDDFGPPCYAWTRNCRQQSSQTMRLREQAVQHKKVPTRSVRKGRRTGTDDRRPENGRFLQSADLKKGTER